MTFTGIRDHFLFLFAFLGSLPLVSLPLVSEFSSPSAFLFRVFSFFESDPAGSTGLSKNCLDILGWFHV